MELEEIKTIVELMAKHNLSEFKVEADNMHLCLRRDISAVAPMQQVAMQPQQGVVFAPPAAAPVTTLATLEVVKVTIDAPIVGTFYRSSSPDTESFTKIGNVVEEDTVVCIIEAMKVLNEIKAEKSGTIREILVENAQSVEYGCPLFVIE